MVSGDILVLPNKFTYTSEEEYTKKWGKKKH